jgi:hypothetical protein
MSVITVKQVIRRQSRLQRAAARRPFRELAQSYLAGERPVEFAVEALLFAIIVAISAWPVLNAVSALEQFLQSAAV